MKRHAFVFQPTKLRIGGIKRGVTAAVVLFVVRHKHETVERGEGFCTQSFFVHAPGAYRGGEQFVRGQTKSEIRAEVGENGIIVGRQRIFVVERNAVRTVDGKERNKRRCQFFFFLKSGGTTLLQSESVVVEIAVAEHGEEDFRFREGRADIRYARRDDLFSFYPLSVNIVIGQHGFSVFIQIYGIDKIEHVGRRVGEYRRVSVFCRDVRAYRKSRCRGRYKVRFDRGNGKDAFGNGRNFYSVRSHCGKRAVSVTAYEVVAVKRRRCVGERKSKRGDRRAFFSEYDAVDRDSSAKIQDRFAVDLFQSRISGKVGIIVAYFVKRGIGRGACRQREQRGENGADQNNRQGFFHTTIVSKREKTMRLQKQFQMEQTEDRS